MLHIKGGKLFHEDGYFYDGNIEISCGKITSVGELSDTAGDNDLVIDASGCYVIPGLTDIHLHGCMGADFCDADEGAIRKIAQYEVSNGVTQICATSMTYPEDVLTKIFRSVRSYCEKNPNSALGATLVGINMEGPFISEEKAAAQNTAYIQSPDTSMFERLNEISGGMIKLCDIAPEMPGGFDFIKAVRNKTHISIAHSDADYDTAMEAFEFGADHVTHIFNGMEPFHHRNPGIIGAASDYVKAYVEYICDNVHSHPSAARAAIKLVGDDRLCFISDSMRATGMPDGESELGGQTVIKNGRRANLESGALAGSVTNLMDCVRIAVYEMNIPLETAVKCAAVNPARAIDIFDEYGSLAKGKRANIVILDDELNIRNVIKEGKCIAH